MVLTLIALGWITLDLGSAAGVTAGARRTALAAFAPVQRVLAAAVRPVDAGVGWLADQRRLHARLDALRAADADLRAATAVNADLAAENARLRDLLDMAARRSHRTVGARVIGRPPGDATGAVVITAGTDRGVRPDMPVVDHHGLVGRVVQATDAYARVEPITSPTSRYAVRVSDGSRSGRLRGGGDGMLRLELTDTRRSARAGAAVVTRTYEGSWIPDGLPVGMVVAGDDGDRDLLVRPITRLEQVDLVQVLIDGGAAALRSDGALPPPPGPGER